jgi:CDP-diacylglycerol--serine O-phosphatidyltransferase
MKKHIPNTITCCNLICGCIATGFALKGDFSMAMTFIVMGAVFDFFDGFMARLLHVSSAIGKELDSLADCITFGFAPAAIVSALLRLTPLPVANETFAMVFPYVAFVIAAFSAIRLAKFNLDERQSTTFYGLPTPANALFWSALALGTHEWVSQTSWSVYLLLLGIACSSWILVADIPMFALKFKGFGWQGNEIRYSFIALCVALIALFTKFAIPAIIMLYVVISALRWAINIKNK